jgi:hypothetical protein
MEHALGSSIGDRTFHGIRVANIEPPIIDPQIQQIPMIWNTRRR